MFLLYLSLSADRKRFRQRFRLGKQFFCLFSQSVAVFLGGSALKPQGFIALQPIGKRGHCF